MEQPLTLTPVPPSTNTTATTATTTLTDRKFEVEIAIREKKKPHHQQHLFPYQQQQQQYLSTPQNLSASSSQASFRTAVAEVVEEEERSATNSRTPTTTKSQQSSSYMMSPAAAAPTPPPKDVEASLNSISTGTTAAPPPPANPLAEIDDGGPLAREETQQSDFAKFPLTHAATITTGGVPVTAAGAGAGGGGAGTVAAKTFTTREVALHNHPGDNWMIIDDEIYDVTKFQADHPGGAKILAGSAGKDATKKFDKYHRRGILERYKPTMVVGYVDYREAMANSKRGFFAKLGLGSKGSGGNDLRKLNTVG